MLPIRLTCGVPATRPFRKGRELWLSLEPAHGPKGNGWKWALRCVLRQDLRYPLMGEDEIQEKFRTLVGPRVTEDRVMDLEQKLLAVEKRT